VFGLFIIFLTYALVDFARSWRHRVICNSTSTRRKLSATRCASLIIKLMYVRACVCACSVRGRVPILYCVSVTSAYHFCFFL
jgi:hypothetical protein